LQYLKHSYIKIFFFNASSPSNGIPAGGTIITVIGTGFYNNSNLSCQFGSTVVLAKFISSTSISCVAPIGSSNTSVPLFVSNNAQQFITSGSYLYATAPNIISVEPSNANFGDTITITGGPYLSSSAPVCNFGSNLVVIGTYINSTTISCVVPQGAGNVALETSNNGEDYGNSIGFIFDVQEFKLDPNNGKSDGSTLITITGTGFLNSPNLTCNFGNTSSPANYVNITTITCLSPPSANGITVSVSVSNNNLVFYGALKYIYQDLVLSVLSPSNGKSLGNTSITVIGSGFISESINCQFTMNSVITSVTAVYINESVATLLTPEFSDGDTVSVNCSNNFIDYSNSLNYIYQDIHVQSISPSSGTNGGGTLITVTTDANNVVLDGSTVECRFGDGTVVVASSTTSNTIGCVTPTGFNNQQPEVFVSNNGVDWFDSGFAFPFTQGSSLPLPAIIGGAIGALVFLGLLATAITLLLKRKTKASPKSQEAELDKIYRYWEVYLLFFVIILFKKI